MRPKTVQRIEIGGLPLPQSIVNSIAAGVWRAPSGVDVWPTGIDRSQYGPLKLYPLDYLPFENHDWSRNTEPAIIAGIDPTRSLIIGDYGVDAPIVLDYRTSFSSPAVLFGDNYGAPSGVRWVLMHPSVEAFVDAIGICGTSRAEPVARPTDWKKREHLFRVGSRYQVLNDRPRNLADTLNGSPHYWSVGEKLRYEGMQRDGASEAYCYLFRTSGDAQKLWGLRDMQPPADAWRQFRRVGWFG